METFDDNRRAYGVSTSSTTVSGSTAIGGSTTGRRVFRTVGFALQPPSGDIGLLCKVDRFPFVPDDPARLALDCYEAYPGLQALAVGHRDTEQLL